MRSSALVFLFNGLFSLTCAAQIFDEDYNPKLQGTSWIKNIRETTDGGILVAGSFDYLNNVESGALLKLDRNGNLWPGFSKVYTDYQIDKIASLPDGRILVCGNFTRINGVNQINIARLNPDGSLDPTFKNLDEIEVSNFRVQSDGKIIFSSGFNGLQIKRFNADGTIDNSFFEPTLSLLSVADITIDKEDKIYLHDSKLVQRLNSNGIPDNTFTLSSGFSHQEWQNQIYVVAPLKDGTVIIGGHFAQYGNSPAYNLVHVNSEGTLLRVFEGMSVNHGVLVVKELTSGQILTGGNFSSVMRYSLTENLPINLVSHSPGFIEAIAETSDFKIVVGGSFKQISSTNQNSIAIIDQDGNVDSSFRPRVNSAPLFGANNMVISRNHQVVTGGNDFNFNAFDGIDRTFIKLDKNGNLLDNFSLPFSNDSHFICFESINNNSLLISGFIKTPGGIVDLMKIHADGSPDVKFNNNIGTATDGVAQRMHFTGKDIFIGGNFNSFNGVPSQSFIILNHDGTVKQAFNSMPGSSQITDFALQSTGKVIAIGEFHFPNQFSGIIRLNTDGTVDNSFAPVAFNNFLCLTIDKDDRIYVGGQFSNGKMLRRFHPNGGEDLAFFQGNLLKNTKWTRTNYGVFAIDILPTNELVLGGAFDEYNNETVHGLLVVDKEGANFRTPSPLLSPSSHVQTVKYLGSNFYVAGKLSFDDGKKVNGLGRFKLNKDEIKQPDPPLDFRIANASESSIDLSWLDKTDAEDTYEIERNEAPDEKFQQIESSPANWTAMIDSVHSDKPETNYRIRSVNEKGASSYVYLKKLSSNAPGPVTLLTISQIAPEVLELNWAHNSEDEHGFIVQRAVDDGIQFENIGFTETGVTHLQDANAKQGHTYFYHVVAFNDAGLSLGASAKFSVVTKVETASKSALSIYPNPCSNILHIASDSSIDNIRIFDQLGQTILNKNCSGEQFYELNTGELSSGVYWLRCRSRDTIFTKMFFKN